jgi:hypothetical protein
MSRNQDEDAKRAAVQQAKREGMRPSEARVTTGASKQIRTVPKGKDRHEHSDAEVKRKD